MTIIRPLAFYLAGMNKEDLTDPSVAKKFVSAVAGSDIGGEHNAGLRAKIVLHGLKILEQDPDYADHVLNQCHIDPLSAVIWAGGETNAVPERDQVPFIRHLLAGIARIYDFEPPLFGHDPADVSEEPVSYEFKTPDKPVVLRHRAPRRRVKAIPFDRVLAVMANVDQPETVKALSLFAYLELHGADAEGVTLKKLVQVAMRHGVSAEAFEKCGYAPGYVDDWLLGQLRNALPDGNDKLAVCALQALAHVHELVMPTIDLSRVPLGTYDAALPGPQSRAMQKPPAEGQVFRRRPRRYEDLSPAKTSSTPWRPELSNDGEDFDL